MRVRCGKRVWNRSNVFAIIQMYRIMEWLDHVNWKKPFKGHPDQHPCNKQERLHLEQVIQSPIQPDLLCLQEWSIHHLFGQPGLVLHYTFLKKILLNCQYSTFFECVKCFELVFRVFSATNYVDITWCGTWNIDNIREWKIIVNTIRYWFKLFCILIFSHFGLNLVPSVVFMWLFAGLLEQITKSVMWLSV